MTNRRKEEFKDIAEGLRRAEQLKNRQQQLKVLEVKYNPLLKLQLTDCSTCPDAMFYWYWKKYLDKRKEFESFAIEVKDLRRGGLISPNQEFFLLNEIDKFQERLWNLGFDILNTHKYKNLLGEEKVVDNVESWVNAIFEMDTIMNRLISILGPTNVQDIRNNVTRRDRMCADEYVEKKICENSACEFYKPWFGFGTGAGTATCRSKKR